MAELFMVVQDGRPIRRGMSRQAAEQHAAYLANGYLRKRANEKRRVAEFDVKPDRGLIAELDKHWKSRHE